MHELARGWMGFRQGFLCFLAWLVLCPLSLVVAGTNTAVIATAAQVTGRVDVARLRFSPGVGEVVRMVMADVDPGVVLAYIGQSPRAFYPTAQELIAFKRLGVPDAVVVAMLSHRPASQDPGWATGPAPGTRAAPATSSPAFAPPVGLPGPAPRFSGFSPPPAVFFGSAPVVSFNNSYPTYVNGYPVYAGYYLPGYGLVGW